MKSTPDQIALRRTAALRSEPLADGRRDTLAQMKRRRAASQRMPSLADGRRDPIDPDRSGQAITIRAIGGATIEFVGCDYAVQRTIKSLGIRRYQRAPRGGAWLIAQSDADDVMASLEAHGYRIDVTL